MKNNDNKFRIEIDPFTKSKTIDWESVAGRIKPKYGFDFEDAIVTGANNDNFSKLIFSPVHKNGTNFLKMRFQQKFFNPSKNDTVSFLFETDLIETFILTTKPIEISNHHNWGRIRELLVPISLEQIKTFANSNLVTWKFKSGKKELMFENGIAHDSFRPLYNLQKSINHLFSDFIEVLKAEDLYNDNTAPINDDSSCYVYLMKDLTNESYKIGISNSPEYRERTLQSEKPNIELLLTKEFHKRSIAQIFEKVLHEYFKNKRIRGEWFNLTTEDIIDLKLILS
ncbi:MAG: GIY-YIG nuclease family protein [Bacteroidetes bacterium]|nr:GIY-YIG nuclease family protein [Bacteroidota bacterium]